MPDLVQPICSKCPRIINGTQTSAGNRAPSRGAWQVKIKLGWPAPLCHTVPDMKSKRSAALPTLQKGQLWKTGKAHVEIMNVGKLLAHYRLFAEEGQKRVPTTMERVRVIQEYLQAQGGKLIRNGHLDVPA